jgi:NADH dehydrogenase
MKPRKMNVGSDSVPRIVVLGGGFGGTHFSQAFLKSLRGRKAELVLIDFKNYFVFYPLLVEAGTGSLEPRHAVVSIRKYIPEGDFRMAEVTGIDTTRQKVIYRIVGSPDEEKVGYDHLVLALGSVTRLPDIPGLIKYGFQLKSMADAVGLRDRAIHLLELANSTKDIEKKIALLRIVVVGANFTGVELAGEFNLIEATDRILPALPGSLAEYAAKKLDRKGVGIILNNTVKQVNSDHVVLKDGRSIPTYTVVWCAGIAPSPVITSSGLPTDDRGYIHCERDLRVRGFENVWAIGDCAVNLGQDGQPYPATAQHAVREGVHLAKNLIRAIDGKVPLSCNIRGKGSLAALGHLSGVANVMGFKFAGVSAWLLWRSVYLMKMPGLSRRARVAMDWALNMLFKRDFVQLGIVDYTSNIGEDKETKR